MTSTCIWKTYFTHHLQFSSHNKPVICAFYLLCSFTVRMTTARFVRAALTRLWSCGTLPQAKLRVNLEVMQGSVILGSLYYKIIFNVCYCIFESVSILNYPRRKSIVSSSMRRQQSSCQVGLKPVHINNVSVFRSLLFYTKDCFREVQGQSS